MSLVLRHKPETIGIKLDPNGWADVDELLAGINAKGIKIDFELLEDVVLTNDKQRFTFDETCSRIRANQGHSVEVDLELTPLAPPELLFHGTVAPSIPGILANGLQKMNRQHVHLSKDLDTAVIVGKRRGNPLILQIAAGKMHADGHTFYRSQNGVWLCDFVPPHYLTQLS